MRSEGMGLRATERVVGKSHSVVARWEQKLAQQEDTWSPPAPAASEVIIVYPLVYRWRAAVRPGTLETGGSVPPALGPRQCPQSLEARVGSRV